MTTKKAVLLATALLLSSCQGQGQGQSPGQRLDPAQTLAIWQLLEPSFNRPPWQGSIPYLPPPIPQSTTILPSSNPLPSPMTTCSSIPNPFITQLSCF